MRDTEKPPDVVTGYLEGNTPSLICLVWFEDPPPHQTSPLGDGVKPAEFNSRWWIL